jgi:hypothetical protein
VNGAPWRPIIPMRLHEHVKDQIMNGMKVTDFGDVLSSLFQADEMTNEIQRILAAS